MNTQPLTVDILRRSVIAVPPLARHPDYSLNRNENARLVRHIEAGGVSILLYGGNANLYHMALSEYGEFLQLVCDLAAPETLVIPSVGPSYGMALDQARILGALTFPTAMILPQKEISTSAGVTRCVADFVRVFQRPAVLYVKHENYILADDVRRLMDDGLLSAIKYAIVRADPARDDYLRALIAAVGPSHIVSGMGEQPAITHIHAFGLPGFTSGCVCIRPDLSTRLLRAMQRNDLVIADQIRSVFKPLEDLRNDIHPIRVLHTAVALGDIAQTGPLLPCLSDIDAADRTAILNVTRRLQQCSA